LAHFCTAGEGEHFERIAAHIKPELELTAIQESAWNEFAAAWNTGEARLRESCDAADAAGDGAGNLLARAEIQLDAGLDAVRTVRPAFEDFYATLDNDQRRTLDQFGHR